MAYQPYTQGYYQPQQMKTPEQLQAETMAMLQQYTQAYRTQPQMQQPIQQTQQQGKSTSGGYSAVSNYSEVEQASTPIDGTASLFFDFANGVFWSKKFVNGRHEVSAYYFKPINDTESRINAEPEQVVEDANKSLLDRIERLEKALCDKQSVQKQQKQKKTDEVVAAEEYAKCAISNRATSNEIADMYIRLSEAEIGHIDMLHKAVVALIEKYRREKGEPTASMQAVWDWEHERSIEQVAYTRKLLESAR